MEQRRIWHPLHRMTMSWERRGKRSLQSTHFRMQTCQVTPDISGSAIESQSDDIFKWTFLNENVWISIKISLKFVPWGLSNNIPALVQIMAWRRPGDKTLSEPMMVSLLTHICVTRSQWGTYTLMLNWPTHLILGLKSETYLLYCTCTQAWTTRFYFVTWHGRD